LNEVKKQWQSELDMIGQFITESLLKHEYANVENFLNQWVKDSDDITEVKATAPNDFVLMQYRSTVPALHAFSQEKHIEFGGKELLVLNVVRDFTLEDKILRNLQLQLLTVSIIAAIILGIALWFTIRRMAFRPLEMEIEGRRRSEEMLERVKNELALKVQERTKELSNTNENLLLEIEERKKAEEEIVREKQKFERIVEGIGAGLIVLDTETRILWANDLMQQWFGPFEKISGKYCHELFAIEYPKEKCAGVRSIESARIERGEAFVKCIDYKKRFFQLTAAPIKDQDGRIVQFVELVEDITEIKNAENALRLSEEKFSKAFRSSPTLMAISILKDGRFVDANNSFLNAFGYEREEVLGHTSLELGIWDKYPDRNKMLQQLKEQGIVQNFEAVLCKKNGDTITVLLSVEMIDIENEPCIIVVALDITERKKLEAQLLHAQKMEAVGQLAGGVAHDFNNILTAVINNCYLLKKSTGEDNKAGEYIDKILALSNNAAKITRELLIFSRKQFFEPLKVDLNDIIRNSRDLIKNFLREDIELKTVLAEGSLPIMADRNQIEQIMMNLATNARDAIADVGELTIETELVEINESFIKTHGFGSPGMYALLSVTDTGTGMDEDTKQKIFEPFFTTKDVGKGTGLGLAIVYGIVNQHNGFITVYSVHEKGTTFRIYFPVIQAAIEAGRSVEHSQLMGKGETILFAEDEPAVRESIRTIFEEFNYRIIEAVDGQDAVEKYFAHKDDIKLLVFDVVMPKKSGKKAFDEIREVAPGIKVVFTSGYAGDKISEAETGERGVVFISKPLLPEKLLSTVRELLQ
jgi:PAS domain S-box-containing protein